MKRSYRIVPIVLLLLAACVLSPAAGFPAPSSAAGGAPGTAPAPTLPPPAQAGVTYYVAMDGDDGNDGSAGHPWATLQHAVESVAPGDTIVVRAGEYAGCRIE